MRLIKLQTCQHSSRSEKHLILTHGDKVSGSLLVAASWTAVEVLTCEVSMKVPTKVPAKTPTKVPTKVHLKKRRPMMEITAFGGPRSKLSRQWDLTSSFTSDEPDEHHRLPIFKVSF